MLGTLQGRLAAVVSDALTFAVLFLILWMIQPEYRRKEGCLAKGGICTATGMGLILMAEKLSHANFWLYLSCFLLMGVLFSRWAMKEEWKVALMISVFFITAQFSLAFVEEWLVFYFFGHLFRGYRALFTQLLLLLFFRSFCKLFLEVFSRDYQMPPSYYSLGAAVSVCTLLIKEYFTDQGTHTYTLADMRYVGTICILTGAVNLLVFYFYSRIMVERRQWEQTQMLLMRQKFDYKIMEEISLSNQVLNQRQHDFKQHIFTLKFLADEGQYGEVQEYCRALLNQPLEAGDIQTGNPVVNAIVNQKSALAREQGVKLEVAPVQLPVSLPVENIDLSVLLGNLLDNAIEACAEIRNATVNVKLKVSPGYLSIRVQNPVAGDLNHSNPQLMSTKENSQCHGWGLPSIRSIAEKYSGEMSVEMKKNSFQATVTLFFETGNPSTEI